MTRSPQEVLADPVRIAAGRRLPEEAIRSSRSAFDRLAGVAAAVLDAPVGVVTFPGAEVAQLAGIAGLDVAVDRPRELPISASLCPFTIAAGGPLLVEDIADDPRFSGHPAVTRFGVRAYAGVPLVESGQSIGTLCVVDWAPHRWTERDAALLEALAASVLTELALHLDVDRRSRLLDAMEAAPVMIGATRGPDHILEHVNPAAVALFGPRPLGVPIGEAFPELETQHLTRLLDRVYATGRPYRAEEAPIRCDYDADGVPEERHFTFTYAAIRDAAGESTGVLVVAVDVTAAVLARRDLERQAARLEAVVRATAAVNRSLDPATELTALARAVVPGLADLCAVNVLERPVPAGVAPPLPLRTHRLASSAGGPGPAELPAESGLTWPGGDPVSEAVRAGRLVEVELDPDALPAWVREVGAEQLYQASRAHTVVSVPVVTAGLVVAVVAFVAFAGRPRYTGADLLVMNQIAAQANVAVGHGLAYQRTREAALTLQRAMLTAPPAVPGLQIVSRYYPAGPETEVGGDWYDAFPLPDGDLAVAIGDVAGHDLAAAATMGQLRSMLRSLACDRGGGPADLLGRLDRVAAELRVTEFTSAVFGRIRPGRQPRLCWSNAGHPVPLLVHGDGRVEQLGAAAGLVLGVRPDTGRDEATVELPPASTLLLYTDGLVERRDAGIDEGVARLVRRAGRLAGSHLEMLCDELLAGAPVDDDVALLAVRVTPANGVAAGRGG